MKGIVADVEELHRKAALPCRHTGPSFTQAELGQATSVLLEELCEVVEALYARPLPELRDLLTKLGPPPGERLDAVSLTKELCDVIYSGVSMTLFLGLPLRRAWNEVAESNLAKVAPDGTVRRRSDGKILKPDGWRPPDIARVLRESAGGVDSPERVHLNCPKCTLPHVDHGEWATTRWHTEHQCEVCQHRWQPADHFTVGIP